MISYLRGMLLSKGNGSIVLDVNGVGYEVYVSKSLFETIENEESEISMLTYLDVKETSLTLYGFDTHKEREVFKLLITVSGISCKTAHSILWNAGFNQIIGLITNKTSQTGFKIPGIGPKKIEMIRVALRDKIFKIPDTTEKERGINEFGFSSEEVIRLEALNALINLGYSRSEGERLIREVLKSESLNIPSTEVLIKKALEIIS